MVELFRLAFNVGGDVPVETLMGIFADFGQLAQAGVDLSAHEALAEANARLWTLARRPGRSLLSPLRDEAQEYGLPIPDEVFNFALYSDEIYPPFDPARLVASWPPSWARFLEQLRALMAAELMPAEPYRFRRVGYENPLVLEVISEGGTAAAALGYLLTVIRDWGPRRQAARARAVDAEDRARVRAELRRFALESFARGDLALTSDVVAGLLSDGLVDAVERLGARGPEVERSSLPSGD
jgi:hypothetical protein